MGPPRGQMRRRKAGEYGAEQEVCSGRAPFIEPVFRDEGGQHLVLGASNITREDYRATRVGSIARAGAGASFAAKSSEDGKHSAKLDGQALRTIFNNL